MTTTATTLTIKTDKRLRDAAKKTAGELGIPLTTVINSLLKQFVRDQKFEVSAAPRLRPQVVRELEEMSKEMDQEMKNGTAQIFTDADSLLKHLKLL